MKELNSQNGIQTQAKSKLNILIIKTISLDNIFTHLYKFQLLYFFIHEKGDNFTSERRNKRFIC